MKLKERVMRRLNGQEVDMTPVGATTAYCLVAFMRACCCTRPAVDLDPRALAMMAIADAGAIMPPKSTWFEPKLRSGLFVHMV